MCEQAIKKLIDTWPKRSALAEELGTSTARVHKWAKHNRIPAGWQLAVVQAAQRRGMTHVTAEWMLRAHNETGAAA